MLLSPPQHMSPLFAAIEARKPDVSRLLLHYGADPNEKILPECIPIIGFAILDTARDAKDTTESVVALLAAGANPYSIPQYMWTEFTSTPKVNSKSHQVHEAARWCRDRGGYEEILASQLHLTFRYFLNKASALPRSSSRRTQVMKLHEITPLLELPYHIIGQEYATTLIMQKLISHIASMKGKPLVMFFTGLSGHGKTELAKQMGKYLSAEHLVVDCTEMQHETDLFGPKAPYVGSEEGSPLNNHLCNSVGKRNIVLLDEFEKTKDEVRQALLLIWQDGEFRDRRSKEKLNCSETIWIVASKIGENEILDFHTTYLKDGSKPEQATAPWEQLQGKLKTAFAKSFGNYVAGRISLIVPFMPFSSAEAAVVGHKYILEMAERARGPVDLSKKFIIENMDLRVVDDGEVCRYLSKKGYDARFGARSLQSMVDGCVEAEVHRLYLDIEEEVTEEMNCKGNLDVEIKLELLGEGGEEIVVSLK